MKIEIKKKLTSYWFSLLQDIICLEFENLEKEFAKKKNKIPVKFKTKKWKKSKIKNEGGGEFRILRNGLVFEKAGVNFSEVNGSFKKEFKKQILGTKKSSSYWASGISVVIHMQNPKIPAMHFNTRFICTEKNWFGGGIDITPSLKDYNETKWFQYELKKSCDKHNKTFYKNYKKWCDKYFYIKHRKEMRGIGGIFFDHKMSNWEKDFLFIRDVGNIFTFIAKKIIKKKMFRTWTKNQKEIQLQKRGRYVEFNLLYDRGTKFGLHTGGETEAILMSLPPLAKWK